MPPKIALLIHSLNGGGAERLMADLATRWSAKFETHLVTWSNVESDGYPLAATVKRHGLNLQKQSRGMLGGLRANIERVRILRQTLRDIAPEFILSFSDQMNIVGLQAARKLDVPTWIAEHSDPTQQRLSRLWELWRRRVYPTCDGCVVLTPTIAAYLAKWIEASKIRVIPPGLAAPEPRVVARRRAEILFLGRLSHEKGVDLLLEAWRIASKALSAQSQTWELKIAGDGPERSRLEDLAADLPRVSFLGWLKHPQELLQESSIFVLPSRYEGFPVALLEAMQAGSACIVTQCSSALNSLASMPQTLELVDYSSQRLADAIVRLASDAELRGRMGAQAKSVAEEYSWERIGPRWDAILDESLR